MFKIWNDNQWTDLLFQDWQLTRRAPCTLYWINLKILWIISRSTQRFNTDFSWRGTLLFVGSFQSGYPPSHTATTFVCPQPLLGNVISVQRPNLSSADNLQFCELEAWGEEGEYLHCLQVLQLQKCEVILNNDSASISSFQYLPSGAQREGNIFSYSVCSPMWPYCYSLRIVGCLGGLFGTHSELSSAPLVFDWKAFFFSHEVKLLAFPFISTHYTRWDRKMIAIMK